MNEYFFDFWCFIFMCLMVIVFLVDDVGVYFGFVNVFFNLVND